MKITTKKGAFGFGAFIQTIRDFFTIQKLSCNAQLWTWREGAKETLNPIPAMLSQQGIELPEKKPQLKNVTPKVPVQSIDHWCNDGASEPEWEQ